MSRAIALKLCILLHPILDNDGEVVDENTVVEREARVLVVDIHAGIQSRVIDFLLPVIHNQRQIADENTLVERKTGMDTIGVAIALIRPAPAIWLAQC